MADLEPGEEGRKRSRPDSAVLDTHSHAAKKLRLERDFAVDAAEKRREGAAVEMLGSEGKFVCEEEGENPLGLPKEGQPEKDNIGEDDESGECIRDSVGMHVNIAGRSSTEAACDDGRMHIDSVLPPMGAGKASNEADPINEDKGIYAQHTGKESKEATVGPRRFTSSTDMLDFFHRLLHGWPLNLDINKYEHMMLEDLLKRGHRDWCEKVGRGVKAFQVRINREFNSRCYYVIRKDGSTKDFSYRKCVDNILPLPKLSKPHCCTSNQNEKDPKPRGSRTRHNTKRRRRMLDKDWGDGHGITRHIQGRGNRGGKGRGNFGHGGQGRGRDGDPSPAGYEEADQQR